MFVFTGDLPLPKKKKKVGLITELGFRARPRRAEVEPSGAGGEGRSGSLGQRGARACLGGLVRARGGE